jgi:hypothetical protein
MDVTTRSVLEILKRPADFPVDLVRSAMADVLEITMRAGIAPAPGGNLYVRGGACHGE